MKLDLNQFDLVTRKSIQALVLELLNSENDNLAFKRLDDFNADNLTLTVSTLWFDNGDCHSYTTQYQLGYKQGLNGRLTKQLEIQSAIS